MTDERWALPKLKREDRCDRCNAEAKVRIVLRNGDVYLCGYHYRDSEQAITEQAIYVHDERGPMPPVPLGDVLDEEFGRLHVGHRGLTSADPCRWCTLRLRLERRHLGQLWVSYFICELCDESAADFDDWQHELKGTAA